GNGMDTIAAYLEGALDKPVVDETGLAGLWAADLKWQMSKTEISSGGKPDPAKVIQAAGEQLGLDLKPTKRQRAVLEVE
ncbi:MAG TPA: TIGR03435 family protein, partial [Candidatus Eisenbacteria bacterium]|nr:TIGR03435 family protein [Candidatus Eisenbacteria bacterium]